MNDFKTSFRNKLAVAGVIATGAICASGNVEAAARKDMVGRLSLKEGIMTTISTERADAFVRGEIRERDLGPNTVALFTLFFAFMVPFGVVSEMRGDFHGAKPKIDFRDADGFACGGHEHGKKKGVST